MTTVRSLLRTPAARPTLLVLTLQIAAAPVPIGAIVCLEQ